MAWAIEVAIAVIVILGLWIAVRPELIDRFTRLKLLASSWNWPSSAAIWMTFACC
jgi:hypothetical protein